MVSVKFGKVQQPAGQKPLQEKVTETQDKNRNISQTKEKPRKMQSWSNFAFDFLIH